MSTTAALCMAYQQETAMKAHHHLLLCTMDNMMGRNGCCWPSQRKLAESLRWSIAQVARTIKECVSLEYLEEEKRYIWGTRARRSSVYRWGRRIARFFTRAIAPARPEPIAPGRLRTPPQTPVPRPAPAPAPASPAPPKPPGGDSPARVGDSPGESQNPEKEPQIRTISARAQGVVDKCKSVVRGSLPRRWRGPDTSTPEGRFEVWRGRCMAWAAGHWAPDKVAAAWLFLMEHDQDRDRQRELLNRIDVAMRAGLA